MSLLGFSVDPKLEPARLLDERGYVDQDIELLKVLKILTNNGGIWVVNKRLGIQPGDIRTLMKWVSSGKKPPLPDIVRKILCLKRSNLTSSVSSTPVSNGLRASHKQIIAEIDKILLDGGARPCAVETTRTPGSVAGFNPMNGSSKPGDPGSEPSSCNCEELTKSIADIRKLLDEMKDRPAVDTSSSFKELNARIESMLKTVMEGLAEQGRIFNEKLNSVISSKREGNAGEGNSGEGNAGLSSIEEEVDLFEMERKIYDIANWISEIKHEFKTKVEGNTLHKTIQRIEIATQQILPTLREIPLLTDRISALEQAVAALSAQVGAAAPAAAAPATLEPAVTALGAALQPILPAIQEIRAAQQADKVDLDRQLAELRAQVEAIPNLADAIGQLAVAQGGNHSVIQAALQRLQESIDALPHPAANAGAAEAPPPDPRISAIQESIANIIATLGTIPKRPDLEAISGLLTELRAGIQHLNESIDDIPSQTAIEAIINTKFNELRPLLDRLQPLADELAGARENIRNIRRAIGEGPGNSVRNTLAAQTRELEALRGQITELTEFVRSPERAVQEERLRANIQETKNGVRDIQRRLIAITAPESAIFEPVLEAIRQARTHILERIDELQGSSGGAQAGAAAAAAEVSDLRGQLERIQTIERELGEEVRIRGEDIERLQRELEECRAELARQTAEGTASTTQIRDLQTRIESLEAELRRKEDSDTRCQETVRRLEAEKAELERQVEELTRRAESIRSELTGELNAERARTQAISNEATRQREQNAAEARSAAEAAAAAVEEARRESEAARRNLDQLRERLTAEGVAAEEIRTQLLDAQTRIEATREYERIVEQLAEARRQLAECEQDRAALNVQMARNRETANARHREELARVQRDAEAAQRERNETYKRKLREAEADFEEARDALNAEYKEEAAAARRECEKIRDKARAEKDAEIARIRAEFEGRLAECERRRTDAEAARTAAQTRITELESARAATNTDLSQLRSQLAEAQAAQTAQRARIQELERSSAAALPPPSAGAAAGDFVPATEVMEVSHETTERSTCFNTESINNAVDAKFRGAADDEKTQIKRMLKDLDSYSCGSSPLAEAPTRTFLATLLRKPFFHPASNIRYNGTQYIFNQRTSKPEELKYFAKAVLQLVEPVEMPSIGPSVVPRTLPSFGPSVVPRAAGAAGAAPRGCVGPSCLGSRRKRRNANNNSGRRTRKAARK